jgi:hypothetical protein
MIQVISLGAGVQSTAMALMAAHGVVTPMPDCAIFADTQWEPKAVYEHLRWLSSGILPFPVHIISAGNLRADTIAGFSKRARSFAAVPWFMKMPNGDEAMGRRQCTSHYKIEPIHKKVRELLGYKPRQRIPADSVEMWIGISVDELIRATPSKVKWITKRFPLLEQRMNRAECQGWLIGMGYPAAPKSSCIGCPFHSDHQWRTLRDKHPDEWQDAIAVDEAIRLQPGFKGEQYMHRSLVPLKNADLTTLEDHGQLNMFNNECEGMCGV